MEEPLPHSRAVWFPEGNTVSVSIGGVIVEDTVRDIVVVEYGTVVEAEVVEVVEVVEVAAVIAPKAVLHWLWKTQCQTHSRGPKRARATTLQ